MQFQAVKFVTSIFLFYLIFNKLDVNNYASYGIVQSIVVFSSLLIGFNIKSSFQKLYSKKYLIKSINSVVAIIIFFSTVLYSIIYFIFMAKIIDSIFINSQHAPDIILFYLYSIFYGLAAIISSLLNASRKTFLYGVSNVLPSLISVPLLFFSDSIYINDVLKILTISHAAMLFFILSKNLNIFLFSSYSSKFNLIIFKYIIGYSWLSWPTLSSKYLIDIFARSILLSSRGELAVAIITFSASLFSIFRSIEQAFFKAVTPLLLLNKGDKKNQLSIVKRLVLFQSIFTLTIFGLSPFWIDLLKLIFSSKPDNVFVPIILFVMACTLSASYIKNYFLSRAKECSTKMRKFFIIATSANLCILVSILSIDLSAINFVLVQLFFTLINLFFIRLFIKI